MLHDSQHDTPEDVLLVGTQVHPFATLGGIDQLAPRLVERCRQAKPQLRLIDTLATTLDLTWISADDWRRLLECAGFEVEACYGWFDRRPYTGGEDSVWLARRR